MPDEPTRDAVPEANIVTPTSHYLRLLIFGNRGIGSDLLLEGFDAVNVEAGVDIYPDTTTYAKEKEEGEQEAVPEIILIDLDRHGETAAPAIERLREGIHRKTPILVFSDIDDPEVIDETYESGASAYIVKPTDPQLYRDYASTIAAFWFEVARTPRAL